MHASNTVNIHQAKTRFSKLVAKVEAKGSVFTICRYGKPVAKLSPIQTDRFGLSHRHPLLSKIKILGDITAPLSEEDWPKKYR